METLLGAISESLWVFLITFVILLVVVSYFLAARNVLGTLKGFVLLVWALIFSPIVYFQKALVAVANFRVTQAAENEGGRQYLLVRLLTCLQALLALVVVALLASGIIRAWDSFLPPMDLRQKNASLEKEIENLDASCEKLSSEVKSMEDGWTNNRQQLIDSYRKAQESQATTAAHENDSLEQQITKIGATPAFAPIKRYLDQSQVQPSIAGYNNTRAEAIQFIKIQQTASPESKSMIQMYIQNWHVLMTGRFEQAHFNDDQYRAKIQPDYMTKKATLPNLVQQLASANSQHKSLQDELKYSPGSFLLVLLITLGTVLVLIWFVGLIIELLWLGVDIAGNVDRIRAMKQHS